MSTLSPDASNKDMTRGYRSMSNMDPLHAHPQHIPPRRPEHPSSSRSKGTIAPGQRTRVETQYRPPLPATRPIVRSRYTSPEDASKTAVPPVPLQRSSGSTGRVYSSSTRPFSRSQSPVMTLRILSPSREGTRGKKSQEDQENQRVHGSWEFPVPPRGLVRSGNVKQASPKRRRLPLRDSILLKRKDSSDSSKAGAETSASTPRKPPPSSDPQTPSKATESMSMPVTPSKARMPDLPRYACKSRPPPFQLLAYPAIRLGARSQDQPQSESYSQNQPARLPPRETNLETCHKAIKASNDDPTDGEKPLVSRICSMILDEEFGAGADRSSTPLKVWDSVVRCLEDISHLAQPGDATNGSEGPSSARLALESKSLQRTGGRAGSQLGTAGAEGSIGHSSKRDTDSSGGSIVDYYSWRHHKGSSGSHVELLPCPYRLRNPARFNVNDKWHCVNGKWKDFSDLQKHIARDHRRGGGAHLFQCPRCEDGFSDSMAFKHHLMLPREQMCEARSDIDSECADPEDGLSGARAQHLSKQIENEDFESWDDLWRWLFPSDRVVPRPVALPAVELPLVEQEVFAAGNMSNLKASLEERLRFLASQSADSDSFSAQIPVITASLSLDVEAHLRSVFISCRNQPPIPSGKSSATNETATGRARNLSSASSSSNRSINRFPQRGPTIAVNETKGSAWDGPSLQRQRQRSNSDEARRQKLTRAATLPVPTMLTIPFPRISALTEQSDVGPSPVSEHQVSPKAHSDAEYSSGVESTPSSAGGYRESTNTIDIRCSKCNMRPSLRPDEDIFSDPPRVSARVSGSSVALGAVDSMCRFSDSGIGILCKSCRMLEELINSYSRASSQSSAKSGRLSLPVAGAARSATTSATTSLNTAPTTAPPFSPNLSVSVDESEEETLFDLILDSATYLDEDGQRKTEVVSPMFPPPQIGFSEYDRFGHGDNFF
ncbi:hypothetical protein CORC01_06948 [Colletotrichum orchidophilum]|uniref:C2H2-type domain-containing protein n=1 Tax=Colletotrichum orchidophilum TaxID=1209926 RepID=A0A1G4B8S4_9PEZI|nr:uncharacterized protein CORC01_06948 [Colletotrichum orchidophilum]OHE97743.1 hypothetical protein CORC01_06948 [Colletotrichum orchidophilum]